MATTTTTAAPAPGPTTYTLSATAYFKLFFHAAKHPHQPVNGVLLGTRAAADVAILDAVPLLHHWTSLSPMMEIGLDLATSHAAANGLAVVGYYQAAERTDDTALAPVGERVAATIRAAFPAAVAFVIDGATVGSGAAALVPYLPQGPAPAAAWRPVAAPAFVPGAAFRLAVADIPAQAAALVRDARRHELFGDFDDHLEDVRIDWLRNAACVPGS